MAVYAAAVFDIELPGDYLFASLCCVGVVDVWASSKLISWKAPWLLFSGLFCSFHNLCIIYLDKCRHYMLWLMLYCRCLLRLLRGKVLSQPRLPCNLEASKEYGIVPNNFIDSSNFTLTCVVLYLNIISGLISLDHASVYKILIYWIYVLLVLYCPLQTIFQITDVVQKFIFLWLKLVLQMTAITLKDANNLSSACTYYSYLTYFHRNSIPNLDHFCSKLIIFLQDFQVPINFCRKLPSRLSE